MGWAAASAGLTVPAITLAQWDQGLENAGTSGAPSGTITGIVKTTMNFLLAIVGFLGIIGFAIAGIMYLTAAGDETRIQSAKKALVMSIIGIIVALLGYVIIQAVTSWLSGSTTEF